MVCLLSAILRMMNTLLKNKEADIKEVINNPENDEDIVTVCDKLLTSLDNAQKNAYSMLQQLEYMKKEFNINSTI